MLPILRLTFLVNVFLLSFVFVNAQVDSIPSTVPVPLFQPCENPINWNSQIRVSFWISREQGEAADIDSDQCQVMLDELNAYFADAGVTFLPFTIQTMNNWQFHILESPLEEMQMTIMYHHIGVVNVHLVEDIANGQPDQGFAYQPPETRDVIVMKQEEFVSGDKQFAHLMGHFFGLYDTFDSEEGIELADGSNCEVAGDLVCDTYADVPGGNASTIDVDCNYSGIPLTDPAGNLYYPPVDNIMSGYADYCRCRFTIGQFDRMLAYRFEFRTQLW